MQIETIQQHVLESGSAGWLIYGHIPCHPVVVQLLRLHAHLVTRRFFYWIPASGEPVQIVHQIEAGVLSHLPGIQRTYISWQELQKQVELCIEGCHTLFMDYSPSNMNPYVSLIDGGTLEWIRSLGPCVLSSQNLLQMATSCFTPDQKSSHFAASRLLERTVDAVWEFIYSRIAKEQRVTDYEVQQFVISEFAAHHAICEEGPICATQEHTALPHYIATKATAKPIERGDLMILDLWCKLDQPDAIYADITRMAIVAGEPTPKQEEIFRLVREAQKITVEWIRNQFQAGRPVHGYEVDAVCREYITSQGYGPYFIHRTGHNLDHRVHGLGAHLDGLEIKDERLLLPSMCFSIEPGIYFPEDFGMRLEHNIWIEEDGTVVITGGEQESLTCLGGSC